MPVRVETVSPKLKKLDVGEEKFPEKILGTVTKYGGMNDGQARTIGASVESLV